MLADRVCDAEEGERIEVEWPSGVSQIIEKPGAGTWIEVAEPAGDLEN